MRGDADPIHCLRTTAQASIAAGGDYLLILKSNQTSLLQALIPLLAGTDQTARTSASTAATAVPNSAPRASPQQPASTSPRSQVFRPVRYAGRSGRQRTRNQVVYGITSLTGDLAGPAEIAAAQRGHWVSKNRYAPRPRPPSAKTDPRSDRVTQPGAWQRCATSPPTPAEPPTLPRPCR